MIISTRYRDSLAARGQKPDSPHDPFGLGYPDDETKPEALRKVEKLVLENWDRLTGPKHSMLDNEERFNEFMNQLNGHPSLHYRSLAELRKDTEFHGTLGVYLSAFRIYDHEHNTNLRETDYPKVVTFLDGFMKNKLGVRSYNINKPGDREIIEKAGGGMPKQPGASVRPK